MNSNIEIKIYLFIYSVFKHSVNSSDSTASTFTRTTMTLVMMAQEEIRSSTRFSWAV